MKQKTALTIAGFDPTGGAGLQADLKVFQSYGVYGLSVATSITAQNTVGVQQVEGISSGLIKKQLNVLLEEFKPDAIKTGVLFSKETVYTLYESFLLHKLENLVIDPVLISSSGMDMALDGTINGIKDTIMEVAALITPNIDEAQIFTAMKISTIDDMKKSADKFIKMGAKSVVIKGGHLKGNAVDVFHDGHDTLELPADKVEGKFHGTGCVYSAAIASNLALGLSLIEAIKKAKEKILEVIKNKAEIYKKYQSGVDLLGIQ